jgi:hypothetical protein
MADTTPSRQRMERGDNDPQPSGRPSNPRQYGKGKPFYYKNKNFNGQQKNSNSYNSPATMKFALQAAARENNQTPFSTVKTHILNKIQASYDEDFDVAKSLDEEKLVNIDQEKPKLAVSRETDPTLKAAEEENNKITLQAEMIDFLERKKALRQGMNKAYAMIYEFHCTKGMQSAIKEHPKFDSEIKNNPIELLKSIKVLMHEPVKARYPLASLTDALLRFANTKQKEDENLTQYTSRFKGERDLLLSIIGTRAFDKFVEIQPGYEDLTDEEKKEQKENIFDKWIGYVFIKGADNNKYGSVKTLLQSQYSMQQDQYPKDLLAAQDMLSQHRLDNWKHPTPKGKKYTNKDNSKENEEEEQKPTGPETSFFQSACYVCGSKDHKQPDCKDPRKNNQQEWYIHKLMDKDQNKNNNSIHFQADQASNLGESPADNWNYFAMSMFNMKKEPEPVKKIMQDYLFLDTGGTEGITNNPRFVTNIKQSNNPIELETTGGTKIEDKEATIPGYKGRIWYDKQAPISTLSFGKLVQEPNIDKITYDSSKEDAFNIHTKDAGTIKFKRTPNGLYAFKPTIDCTKAKNNNNMPAKTPNKIINKANKAAKNNNIKKNNPI